MRRNDSFQRICAKCLLHVTEPHSALSTMALPRKLQPAPLGDTDPFTPTRARPVRVRAREMPVDSHFEPHRHAWAQLAYCASGVIQVNLHAPTAPTSYIVPPSRAVLIAPGALHAVAVLEAAAFRTLYIDPSVVPPDWSGCRVMAVTPLLRGGLRPGPGGRTSPSARTRSSSDGAGAG